MVSKQAQISDSEWKVMEVVWEHKSLSSQDIVAQLTQENSWSAATIKTMLHRLVQKEAIAFEKEGNRYFYQAAVTRKSCVRKESKSFMQRVFSGDPGSLLLHFVETNQLSPEEIEQLRAVLDDRENA